MLFPNIEHIDDLWPHVQHKDEIILIDRPNGTQVISYQISTSDTFDSAHALECRGITFKQDGSILMRPIHKFFNMGEKEKTLPNNIDWDNVEAVFDKLDGSMINTCIMNGRVVCKSKISFESDVAVMAQRYIDRNVNIQKFVAVLHVCGRTATWEFTSPQHPIVLRYSSEKLSLLHVRDNITGEYMSVDEMNETAKRFNIDVVKQLEIDDVYDYAINRVKHEEDIEGCIIKFKTGDMIKVKCDWYLGLHRTISFLRIRDIAQATANESIDDIKGKLALVDVDLIPKVEKIEKMVWNDVSKIRAEVMTLYKKYETSTPKEMFTGPDANNPLIHLVAKLKRGMDSNSVIMEYFDKYEIKKYPLDVIEGAVFGNG